MSMQTPPGPIAYAPRTNTNGGRSRRLNATVAVGLVQALSSSAGK